MEESSLHTNLKKKNLFPRILAASLALVSQLPVSSYALSKNNSTKSKRKLSIINKGDAKVVIPIGATLLLASVLGLSLHKHKNQNNHKKDLPQSQSGEIQCDLIEDEKTFDLMEDSRNKSEATFIEDNIPSPKPVIEQVEYTAAENKERFLQKFMDNTMSQFSLYSIWRIYYRYYDLLLQKCKETQKFSKYIKSNSAHQMLYDKIKKFEDELTGGNCSKDFIFGYYDSNKTKACRYRQEFLRGIIEYVGEENFDFEKIFGELDSNPPS